MNRLIAVLVILLAGALPGHSQEFATAARSAWVYDDTTNTVLLEKNADQPVPPASMSKLMTIYMAFDAIQRGQLTLEQTLPVSESAMSYGGSSMFLNTLDRPSVSDLLRGVIVLSGNDATVVLAEALSPDGTEAGFAELMNKRAAELGMTQSHFLNSNGWPADGHVMSARDLGVLAEHLIDDFPDLYPMFAEEEFEFDGRVPSNSLNRNPMLGLVEGADGLKTGHTVEAGYGLVGSAVQGGRRVIFVITGLPSEEVRRTEGERIANWAFLQFALRDVGRAGARIAEAEVWMGTAETVGLVLPEDVSILVPGTGSDSMSASVIYQGPVAAPVTAGQEIAELVLVREGLPEVRLPLLAEADVPRGGFMSRIQNATNVLMGKAGMSIDLAPSETVPTEAEVPDEARALQDASTQQDTTEDPVEDDTSEPTGAVDEGGEVLMDGD